VQWLVIRAPDWCAKSQSLCLLWYQSFDSVLASSFLCVVIDFDLMGNDPSKPQQNLELFLSKFTLADLLKAKPSGTQLRSLNRSNTIEDACALLAKHTIHCVTVYDNNAKAFIGLVDVLDLVTYLKDKYNAEQPNLFFDTTVDKVIDFSHTNPVLELQATAQLSETIRKMQANKAHRVVVVNERRELLSLLTQSDVLAFMAAHLKEMHKELAHLELKDMCARNSNAVISVSEDTVALEAFAKLGQNSISAIGVVNQQGVLVTSLSAAQLRGITRQSYRDLSLKLKDYSVIYKAPHFAVCEPNMKFQELLDLMHREHLYRVFLVDSNKRPASIIALSDIIAVFARP